MSDVQLSEKLQKIAEQLESLTVIEMADLAKYLEDKFGVSAAPMMGAAAPAAAASSSEPAEEKTEFSVVLAVVGDNKLGVIKTVRELVPSLGLMDAKKLVESAPKEIIPSAKKEEAEAAKTKLEAAGAKVELK